MSNMYGFENLCSSYDISHHGIKGQKWGVRNYQNPDGTLTAAGKGRYLKRLEGNKVTTVAKGTTLYRSQGKEDETKIQKKLYVSVNEKEAAYYQTIIGAGRIQKKGEAFAAKYLAKNPINIPSVKEQKKIELLMLKDEEARRDVVDSLVKKGYSRSQIAKMTKPVTDGQIFATALMTIPLGVIHPGIPLVSVDAKRTKQANQLALVRNTMGDQSATKINEKFENVLRERGYQAYRDTNDRNNSLKVKSAIVVIDPEKNVKFDSSDKITKENYTKAYVEAKRWREPKMDKLVTDDDLIKDGEKEYDSLMKKYAENLIKAEKAKEINEKLKEIKGGNS